MVFLLIFHLFAKGEKLTLACLYSEKKMPGPLRRLNCLDPTVRFFIKSPAAVSDWPMALSTIQLQLTSVNLFKVGAKTAEPEILHEVLTGAPEVAIHNIFVEYHGIAFRKYLTEKLHPKYDVHLCSVSSDRQGTLLFAVKDLAR